MESEEVRTKKAYEARQELDKIAREKINAGIAKDYVTAIGMARDSRPDLAYQAVDGREARKY